MCIRDRPFTDVTSGDWFYDAVAYVYDKGMMEGRPSGSGSTAVNTASTVTLEAGILKVYLPSPL